MIAVTQYPTQFHVSNENVELDLKVALYMTFITVNKMMGRDLYNESNKVYYSTDGGESFDFESVEFPIQQLYNYKNEFFFAYGANGVIYKSTNGGGTLGIKDVGSPEQNIVLHPNPSSEFLNISYDSNSIQIDRVEIYTVTGQRVKTISSDIETIKIEELSKGSYMVVLHTNQGVTSRKILIDK